jgi:hypothetical protein
LLAGYVCTRVSTSVRYATGFTPFFSQDATSVEDAVVVTGFLVTDEEVVRAADGNATKPSFGRVVVGWDGRVTQETAKCFVVTEEITDRLRDARAGIETATMATSPAEQFREERTRACFAQREFRVGERTDLRKRPWRSG